MTRRLGIVALIGALLAACGAESPPAAPEGAVPGYRLGSSVSDGVRTGG